MWVLKTLFLGFNKCLNTFYPLSRADLDFIIISKSNSIHKLCNLHIPAISLSTEMLPNTRESLADVGSENKIRPGWVLSVSVNVRRWPWFHHNSGLEWDKKPRNCDISLMDGPASTTFNTGKLGLKLRHAMPEMPDSQAQLLIRPLAELSVSSAPTAWWLPQSSLVIWSKYLKLSS